MNMAGWAPAAAAGADREATGVEWLGGEKSGNDRGWPRTASCSSRPMDSID